MYMYMYMHVCTCIHLHIMHKPHNQDPLYVTHFTLIIHAELATPALRRDALRYLCLLLPQANRDTLQELLRFLTRVALRSNGIILIDGTEVCVCVCVCTCPPTIILRVENVLGQWYSQFDGSDVILSDA